MGYVFMTQINDSTGVSGGTGGSDKSNNNLCAVFIHRNVGVMYMTF